MARSPRPTPGPDAGADIGALFAAERTPMLRLATLLVGSAAIAEEVVQDAFASISRHWNELERPGAYLRTSVVHGCAAVLRRRSIEDRYRAGAAEPAGSEIPTRLVELRDALDRLSDRQRIVIVLRYFIDAPDDEIAAALGVRPATVRSLSHRAITALREELT